jgi:RsiW-degrading membrane proteinase PrsW (M82 family)
VVHDNFSPLFLPLFFHFSLSSFLGNALLEMLVEEIAKLLPSKDVDE